MESTHRLCLGPTLALVSPMLYLLNGRTRLMNFPLTVRITESKPRSPLDLGSSPISQDSTLSLSLFVGVPQVTMVTPVRASPATVSRVADLGGHGGGGGAFLPRGIQDRPFVSPGPGRGSFTFLILGFSICHVGSGRGTAHIPRSKWRFPWC